VKARVSAKVDATMDESIIDKISREREKEREFGRHTDKRRNCRHSSNANVSKSCRKLWNENIERYRKCQRCVVWMRKIYHSCVGNSQISSAKVL